MSTVKASHVELATQPDALAGHDAFMHVPGGDTQWPDDDTAHVAPDGRPTTDTADVAGFSEAVTPTPVADAKE